MTRTPSHPSEPTSDHIEALQDRIEAMLMRNPETSEQWADICAMEAVIVEWRTAS